VTPYQLGRPLPDAGPAPLRPPIAHGGVLWYRNVDLLSIAYALRPRLRPDSPAADQHGCGTLWPSVGRIHTALALLIPAFALPAAPAVLPLDLLRCWQRSPTNLAVSAQQSAFSLPSEQRPGSKLKAES
jgi:hypothetical protein